MPKGPDASWAALRAKLGRTDPPDFLLDVYYDLRERRLLPLLALVAVAILAVPLLLGDPADVPPPETREAAVAEAAEAGREIPGASELVVVEARPGLRDYRERLGERSPSNPFLQQYTSVPPSSRLESVPTPPSGEAGGSGAEAGGGTAEGGGAPPSPEGGGSPSPGGGGAGEAGRPRLFVFVIDLWFSRSERTAEGGRKSTEPKPRRNVRPLTPLPGRGATVVTSMGVNLLSGKVLLLVSDDVEAIAGEHRCLTRNAARVCELLEVRPGFPLDFAYGPNGVRYRIKITGVDVVPAGRLGGGEASAAPRSAHGAVATP